MLRKALLPLRCQLTLFGYEEKCDYLHIIVYGVFLNAF